MIEQHKCLVCGKHHPAGMPCPDMKAMAVNIDKMRINSTGTVIRMLMRGVK